MTEVALHAIVSGPAGAQTVVLGPSLGTTVDVWQPQLPLLEQDFQVVRYDHRGHDGSGVPAGPYTIAELGADVVRLLDSLRIARVHYVGLSLGGMLGMWLAAHAPDRVDRLALVSTSAFMPPASAWRERAETVRTKGTSAVAESVVNRWFTADFAARHAAVVDHYTEALAALPADGYAGCCDAIGGMDLRADLAAIRAPTVVVVGVDDPATPPAHAQVIAGGIAGAHVVRVDDAAHLANVEQPDEVGRLVAAHLGAQ
ncbi:MAG: 3-oxoadipate enol-lactonase [Frankiaceae bacterium]|nr:3-oxoadipate enol-lactonase [Frankiaceae bacterium]